MKIEDIKIEDTADANYVIRKFFNNDFSNLKITQLEQLVLTVYAMGKKSGVPADPCEAEPESAAKAPEKENPFNIHDKVKVLEEVEIGHSGEFINTDSEGKVTSIDGDTLTVLFEEGEEGEMIEVNVPFNKLEKVE